MEEKTAKLTIKEIGGVDVYYKKYGELAFDVMKNDSVPTTMYFPDTKGFYTGLVSMNNALLDFDEIQKEEYHFSRIYPEEFNKQRCFLKTVPMTYQDAVLWNGEMYYLNLETAEVRRCRKERWYRSGYGCRFLISFDDGEELELRAISYEEEYIFLKP